MRDRLRTALLTPVRAMRLRYLPLLMIYYAYGALGLVTIAETFWIKEALTFTPAELASIAVWLTLPWTIKMVFGQLAEFRADPRLRSAAPMSIIGASLVATGLDRSCRRRRRLDHLRRQERALRRRSAPHRDRRRAARRGRRRHDHGGRRSQKPRRHAASYCRGRARARPRAGAGQARAVVRHLSVAGLSGWLAQIVQLRDRVPARADRSRHLGHRAPCWCGSTAPRRSRSIGASSAADLLFGAAVARHRPWRCAASARSSSFSSRSPSSL